jgi:hypothetical protein
MLLALPAIALCAAACSSANTPDRASAPEFPTAVRGCWEAYEPENEEHGQISETLTVTDTHLVREASGVGRRRGTIELVQQLTPNRIEGRITATENGHPITLATTLEVGGELGSDELLLREGDAGSQIYTRCAAATLARQNLSLVIARTARQDQPRPAPCGPDGSCGDFYYRADFTGGRVIAGREIPTIFEARLKLHTPLISPTTLAMIVERQSNGELLVRRRAGFNGRSGVACLREPDEAPVDWRPAVSQVRLEKGDLCVFDSNEIDPAAPKN